MKCDYCGKELTQREIELTAEAENLPVEEISQGKVELMCDDCADGIDNSSEVAD